MKNFDDLKNRLFLIIFVPVAVLSLFAAGMAVRSLISGSRLKNRFTPADSPAAKTQYRSKDSMEDMDLEAFGAYFIFAMTAEGRPDTELALPCNVHYYRMENGRREKAFTMKKGTIIVIQSLQDPGRGIQSFPTFDRGIRYAKPFNIEGGNADDSYYYVKLSELEKVASELISRSPSLEQARRAQGLSLERAVYEATRLTDKIFYNEGIYLSPDLERLP